MHGVRKWLLGCMPGDLTSWPSKYHSGFQIDFCFPKALVSPSSHHSIDVAILIKMADNKKIGDDGPVQTRELHEKVSSEDEAKNDIEDPTRNMSFSSQKEAKEYERKKANALLANPLRGYTHAQLRKMGKAYALGTY